MMKPHRRRRLGAIVFAAFGLSVAAMLTLFALRQNINMFHTPTEVANGGVEAGTLFRIGGMVKDGSVEQRRDSLAVSFVTTDFAHDVPIEYEGILPDLFREGQGIVAEGRLDALGVFRASRVLAKHDENYMSPEVRAALEQAGVNPDTHRFGATPED